MALVVGINIAVCIHVLMSAHQTAPSFFTRFYPLHWWGVIAIFLSGLALLAAYPAKALTNPVFYLKLVSLAIGLTIAKWFQNKLDIMPRNEQQLRRSKVLACAALAAWLVTLFAGRFLAYTHSILLAARYY